MCLFIRLQVAFNVFILTPIHSDHSNMQEAILRPLLVSWERSTDRGECYVTGEKLGETGREPKLLKSNQSHVDFII